MVIIVLGKTLVAAFCSKHDAIDEEFSLAIRTKVW